MGKLTDNRSLRCVHCHNTETPLWRAGPDGPKTLCNACGVRYKKGKLILYKDPEGNLTAIKRGDAIPVHVPPAPKKSSKKNSQSSSTPSSPSETNTKRTIVKKVLSDSNLHHVGKKPRSRSRRATAGQLPGRYASKTLPNSHQQWLSPTPSPHTTPSSPLYTPPFDDPSRSDPLLGYPQISFPIDHLTPPSIYPITDPEDDNIFPDMACLGLDCSADPGNQTLLNMPADPSSAEQFTFAFSSIGRDCIEMDKPDRVEALRSLVVDRTRNVSVTYEATLKSLARLCELRYLRARTTVIAQKVSCIDECRNFVRAFAHEQTSAFNFNQLPDLPSALAPALRPFGDSSSVMLSEKTTHSSAVENFKTLMDSTELAGFAETCMVELLAEDVVSSLGKQGYDQFNSAAACRVPNQGLVTKPIPTPA